VEENITNICFIIGTRPQYVKLKPIHDYLNVVGCKFFVIDTNQHYSDNMSKKFVDEFNLKIDYNLSSPNVNSVDFISESINCLSKILVEEKPSVVVVFGDTNTTLAGALATNKNGFRLAHIEAGMRCGDKKRPEEVNRIITDILSDIHFIIREEDSNNVSNPVCVGDMEVFLLNQMYTEGRIAKDQKEDYILMTIHRDENVKYDRLCHIFNSCMLSGQKFIFPIHHRTKLFIQKNNIKIPKNIQVIEPLTYFGIANSLSKCKAVFSDSGGILQTMPFFGKKCLVPLNCIECEDLITLGYAKLGYDFEWLLKTDISNDKNLHYVPDGCKIIHEYLKGK